MRFFAGFLTASVIWAGAFYAYSTGLIGGQDDPDPAGDLALAASAESESDPNGQARKRRRLRGRMQARDPRSGEPRTGSVALS